MEQYLRNVGFGVPYSLLTKGTAMKTFTLADVYYVCGIIFFVVATVYLLGANTMAVFN